MINYDEKLYSFAQNNCQTLHFLQDYPQNLVASPANLDHMPNIHIRSKDDLYRCIYM